MKYEENKIILMLPAKPEFVSIARLATAGIAARMGFDIETGEDIKVSLSEVCNKIVSMSSVAEDCYSIEFTILDTELGILVKTENPALRCIFDKNDEELSISIINALMDVVDYCPGSDIVISMSISTQR